MKIYNNKNQEWYVMGESVNKNSSTYLYAQKIVEFLNNSYNDCFYIEQNNMKIVFKADTKLPVEYSLCDNKLTIRQMPDLNKLLLTTLISIEFEFQKQWKNYVSSMFKFYPKSIMTNSDYTKLSNYELLSQIPSFDKIFRETILSDYWFEFEESNFIRKYNKFFNSTRDVLLHIVRIMLMSCEIKKNQENKNYFL